MADEVQCVICIDFYSDRENDSFIVASCGHLYHKFCIDEELRRRPRCPMCSASLDQSNFRTIFGVVPKKSIKTFKITTVGDAGVGKTCLLKRYCRDAFHEHERPTIGTDVLSKTVTIGDEDVKLSIWDTAGQEAHRSITPQYVRDSQGIVLVYDTLHSETLENCWEWFQVANEHAPNAIKILLGSRKDLTSCSFFVERGVCPYCNRSPCPPNKCHPPTVKQIEDMAARMGVKFFETSAKTDMNLDIAFRTLVGQILSNRHLVREAIKNDSTRRRIILESANDDNHGRDGKCCNCNT